MRRVRVKPSRFQSFIGFIVGIVFVIVGIVFAIPNAGGFGIFWTILAIVITVINAANAFGSKGVPAYEIETDIFDNQNNNTNQDFAKKLRDLEQLRNDRLISEEEFERKRQDIMNEKW